MSGVWIRCCLRRGREEGGSVLWWLRVDFRVKVSLNLDFIYELRDLVS